LPAVRMTVLLEHGGGDRRRLVLAGDDASLLEGH
jgi:hypothetical protein